MNRSHHYSSYVCGPYELTGYKANQSLFTALNCVPISGRSIVGGNNPKRNRHKRNVRSKTIRIDPDDGPEPK